MTNINKINGKQKELLAQFMMDHPNLAKNIIPNSRQGKALSNRLWDELTGRLNAYGPQVKKAAMWRKVFADQKDNAKKKLSFNMQSKKKTGGGPYEELLSPAEEQIVQAAGIEAAVEGVSTIKSFGTPTCISETIPNEEQSLRALLENDDSMEVGDEKCMEKNGNSQESKDLKINHQE